MLTFKNKAIDYNFFVVSSDNCTEIKPRLYGYVFFDNKIYINGNINRIPKCAEGTYVNIYKQENSLFIQQDHSGSYGLYLYQDDEFFAISNSFYYLFNYLKNRVKLSLNEDYLKYFLVEPLSSLSVEETLINEIKILSQDCEIFVDLQNRKLSVNNLFYQKSRKFSPDSKEAIDILDNWYYKWQDVLVSLYKNNQNITVDLTGGMDSRAVFSIFNTSRIDLNNIRVNSSTRKVHTHPEDYEIATIISKQMGFELNRSLDVEAQEISSVFAIQLSLLAKLGIHKQMYFRKSIDKEWIFCFTGSGGEAVRKHWNKMTLEEFLEKQQRYHNFSTIDFREAIDKIAINSIEYLKKIYGYVDNDQFMKEFYINTRHRTHFGRSAVENFLFGRIFLNPLNDQELQNINITDDLLLCIIYDRYLKNLESVRFDSNRELPQDLVTKAKYINKQYPHKKISFNFSVFEIIDGTNKAENRINSEDIDSLEPKEKLIELFRSDKVKTLSTYMFGDEIYRRAEISCERGGHFPERLAGFLVALSLVKEGLDSQNDLLFGLHDTNIKPLADNCEFISRVLNCFRTARIDVKNVGDNNNNLQFSKKSIYSDITSPQWFSKHGVGYVVEDNSLNFDSLLTIIGDGVLDIYLRGLDIRDINGFKIPVYINFTSLKVDGIEKLSGGLSIWHDKPFYCSIPVVDGQKLHIEARWKPHGYLHSEFLSVVNQIFSAIPFRMRSSLF